MNCKGTQLGQSCGRIGLWTHGSFLIEFLCNWVLHMGGWHLGHIHHTDFNDTLQSTWRFLHKWVGMKSWGLTPVPGPGQPGAFQQRRCHSVGKRRAEERFHGRHGDGNCPAALHVAEKQPKRLTTYCTIYIYVHVYIYVECIYIYTYSGSSPCFITIPLSCMIGLSIFVATKASIVDASAKAIERASMNLPVSGYPNSWMVYHIRLILSHG